MKKTLIIESCERKVKDDFSSSSIVHIRNSFIIQNILECDLISHVSEIDNVINNKYDYIICMYASPYMKYNEYIRILDVNRQAKIFWLVNDHDCEDNVLLRKWVVKHNDIYHVVCNNPREGYRHWILGKNINGKKLRDWIGEWYTINLNALVYNEIDKSELSTKQDCIYYGTYRKWRAKDIIRYNGFHYDISTSKKNVIKYQTANISANFVDRLSWEIGNEALKKYKYSIYFEDEHTHTNYAFMANRFYECVMCDVLLFFDYKCDLVISKSGYIIDAFLIVKDATDITDKIKELENNEEKYLELLNGQRANNNLILTDRNSVVNKIKEIFS